METGNFLNSWRAIEDKTIEDFLIYIESVKSIATEYAIEKQSSREIGFNAFTLASGLYYRENYHSDILKEILDPRGCHKEGNAFLYQFIDSVNDTIPENECKIKKSDYSDSEVIREKHKIDILIKSTTSNHCIIIENKLHNAGDMQRQLPRYYKKMKNEEGYEVDRIIYIPLDRDKKPNDGDWTQEDKNALENKVSIMLACDEKRLDLVYSWLMKCQKKAKFVNTVNVIQQYIELLEYLADSINMYKIMDDFYRTICDDEEKRKTVKSISEMYQGMMLYRAQRLKSHFESEGYQPFSSVWIWNNFDCILEKFNYKEHHVTLDMFCNEDGYTLKLWCRNDYYDLEELFPDLGLLKGEFVKADGNQWFKYGYKFNQEKEVIALATEIVKYFYSKKHKTE